MSGQRLRVPEDVIFRDLDGEAVILNLKTGTYFGLDAVGTRMWTLIGELGERDKVLDALLAEYDVDGQQLRGDFDGLVAQLVGHGLLEASGEPVANGPAE